MIAIQCRPGYEQGMEPGRTVPSSFHPLLASIIWRPPTSKTLLEASLGSPHALLAFFHLAASIGALACSTP
ncbi:hypothetical protein B0H14DRAFT_3487229 [Mycena olivaceomarginata]|nr:hypothetical protein B0H14DRAFT_3487229 [Mycena olivaceomarginata]